MIQARIRLSEETMAMLNGMTHGNPLYAEQLVSHWIDSQLTLTADGYSVTVDQRETQTRGVEGLWGTDWVSWLRNTVRQRCMH